MNFQTSSRQNQQRTSPTFPMEVYFNGKFMSASPTGVHRVAEELISALDKVLAGDPALATLLDGRLVFPKNVRHQQKLTEIFQSPDGRFTWIPWEQLDLPRISADGLCVSLCNLGPLASRNAITMMHDAQVYSSPASYSFAFRLWYKTIQPMMGRRHSRILTVSNFSKTELVKYKVAPEEKIFVVHNGVDHVLRITPDYKAAAQYGLEGSPFVLALSNTQHHKNIRVLLEAFQKAKMAAITLALFGSAKREDFEALGFTVPDNVRFLGRVSDEELAGLMAHAAASACPSLTEGFGLPPLEAMLMGCPAIIAPCGALPEVCGDAALIADPYNPGEWSHQILQLVSDSGLAKDMRAKGLQQASFFTWERAARQLLQNIAEVSGVSLPISSTPLVTAKPVRLSLIMSTLNRSAEVLSFLESLTPDKNQDIELIIVDQNDAIDLTPIIAGRKWPFKIIHKHVPNVRGLSRGRNIGLTLATGDIICFPDDDCTYPPRLLGDVVRTFEQRDADIVCGRPADENGQSINGRFVMHPMWVRKDQVFVSQTEWLLFFRREALTTAGQFCEEIGLGASSPWQSAEGQDLTLNAIERGCRLYYDPALIGHHPKYNITRPDPEMLNRALKYGRGMGFVIAKHRFPATMLAKILLRPLLGALTYACQFNLLRAEYYLRSAIGRFEGYIAGCKASNGNDKAGIYNATKTTI